MLAGTSDAIEWLTKFNLAVSAAGEAFTSEPAEVLLTCTPRILGAFALVVETVIADEIPKRSTLREGTTMDRARLMGTLRALSSRLQERLSRKVIVLHSKPGTGITVVS
jgi:hypothetical protein